MNTSLVPILRRSAIRIAGGLLAAAASLVCLPQAEAHISYSGRNFGTYTGLESGSQTITNQTVTGNYGWADAADGILGDSHRGRAFRFTIQNEALVTLSVTANPLATTNSLGGLTPAFSIYSGLAAIAPFAVSQTTLASSADHDGSAASISWRIAWVKQNVNPAATDEAPTDGSWNALGDWQIGGDGDLPGDFAQLSTFIYKASAKSTESGGTATGTFLLPAGDYTVFIGGNNLANKTSDTALLPHGILATFSVSPKPVLTIAQKVFVAWPSNAVGTWLLQSANSADAATWTPVNATTVTVDGQSGVLLDSKDAEQYFRLVYQP